LRVVKLAIAAVVATVSLTAVATAPTYALATATNERLQVLTENPTIDMPVSCTERSIYLTDGTYDWRVSAAIGPGDSWGDYSIQLGAAWYTWQDCLIPFDGYYEHTSTLYPAASTGWTPVTMVAPNALPNFAEPTIEVSWGSELIPQ
jgi:hypothetical protein